MTVKTLAVRCPVCTTEVLMTKDFPYRPFCSQRCKMIDFGDWAAESHRIEGEMIDGKSSDDAVWPEEDK